MTRKPTLDIDGGMTPDFYLVFTGSEKEFISEDVYLFDVIPLITKLKYDRRNGPHRFIAKMIDIDFRGTRVIADDGRFRSRALISHFVNGNA